jgi:Fic family protein
VQDVEQRRAINLNTAYSLSQEAATKPDWCLDMDFICRIHAAITEDIPHERNQPGRLRDNSKEIITYVGDQTHGGRYKPPQYERDIRLLLEQLIAWYQALYLQLTDKTKQRDLRRLREEGLIVVDKKNRLWPGVFQTDDSLE